MLSATKALEYKKEVNDAVRKLNLAIHNAYEKGVSVHVDTVCVQTMCSRKKVIVQADVTLILE